MYWKGPAPTHASCAIFEPHHQGLPVIFPLFSFDASRPNLSNVRPPIYPSSSTNNRDTPSSDISRCDLILAQVTELESLNFAHKLL
jgi:hypothetical protein